MRGVTALSFPVTERTVGAELVIHGGDLVYSW
jgi:hypothetical protein